MMPAALRGARSVVLVLAVAGVAVSTYLTIQHFDAGVTLACPASATINCEKVTTSEYSKLAGIPVALLGLLFFVAMVATFVPFVARWSRIDQARLGASMLGICFVLYLVWAELFRIDAICLWCTGVHVLTLLLLFATSWVVAERS
jgi:uncharacterized membrane protein